MERRDVHRVGDRRRSDPDSCSVGVDPAIVQHACRAILADIPCQEGPDRLMVAPE
jgi:hypothetical protein